MSEKKYSEVFFLVSVYLNYWEGDVNSSFKWTFHILWKLNIKSPIHWVLVQKKKSLKCLNHAIHFAFVTSNHILSKMEENTITNKCFSSSVTSKLSPTGTALGAHLNIPPWNCVSPCEPETVCTSLSHLFHSPTFENPSWVNLSNTVTYLKYQRPFRVFHCVFSWMSMDLIYFRKGMPLKNRISSEFSNKRASEGFIEKQAWVWSSNTLATQWVGKSRLIGKDHDAGKDWEQEEKRAAEDEMVK